ncbi:hypothetical protein [Nocardia sp. CA-119907]|uniref:hypothetical protein n=1 Tax=Nocardia sp. CA-119907 TaxID=3239973 RepID=UPI003D97B338
MLAHVLAAVVCSVPVAVVDELCDDGVVVAATVVLDGAVVVSVGVVVVGPVDSSVDGSARVVVPADDGTTSGTVVSGTTVTGGALGGVVPTGAAPAYPIRFPESRPAAAIMATTTVVVATTRSHADRRCGSRWCRIGLIQVSPALSNAEWTSE